MTNREKRPPSVTVVGLLGGVASGKSIVAHQFAALGAEIIDGDQLGHIVLGEPDVIELLRQRWGTGVVDGDGRLDRREIARRVFSEPAELAYLEQVTHPRIRRLIQKRIEAIREQCRRLQCSQVVVLDAAVMLKAGWDVFCDSILYVDASPDTRKKRAIERGWTNQQFEQREAAQVSIEEKRRRSDIVIDNEGGLEQTYEQVLKAWKSLSH